MALAYPNSLQELISAKKTILVTDGASRGNPGPAGWACVILCGEINVASERCGFSARDTNNRMEMLGCLEGLKFIDGLALKNSLLVLSDSKFLIDALTSWRFGWRKRNWTKSDGSPVLHSDVWQELDPLVDKLKPKFFHVEAHKGHPANSRCDELAVAAAMQEGPKLFEGTLENYPHFKQISFEKVYSQPRYLCWSGTKKIEFAKWPEAQEYMRKNPGCKVKKVHSAEEVEKLVGR